MTNVPLNESATVTLNGAGAGTAKLGPISAREVWTPSRIAVKASSATSEAQCLIYVGDQAIDSNFIDGTFSGSSGDATDAAAAAQIKVGAWIWAKWTGGDAGATATLTVTGTKAV